MPRKKQVITLADVEGLLDRDAMITSAELAVYMRVSVGHLDTLASTGDGPVFIKSGTRRLYHPSDVKKWMRASKYSATGVPAQEAA